MRYLILAAVVAAFLVPIVAFAVLNMRHTERRVPTEEMFE